MKRNSSKTYGNKGGPSLLTLIFFNFIKSRVGTQGMGIQGTICKFSKKLRAGIQKTILQIFENLKNLKKSASIFACC